MNVRGEQPPGKHVSMLLGVYVLGGLRGDEEVRVTNHLARCGRCQAEYEELAEVPPLLDLVAREEAAPQPEAPPNTLRKR
ncbi:MAG TPA: zf-HC2 domain-containing protein [Streptosporangiaceae bacterium]|nr:zf-HC2 domain-containing protein [Streptosporangiaceae bacterium]